MNQTSIKREMVATCITPLHSPIETQVDEGLQGTIPAINSCVRLCISLHGSGSTILMPGFHCDSCGLFCPLGQNMRWSSRFCITDLRCPLCNCVLRDFPVTSLPFDEIDCFCLFSPVGLKGNPPSWVCLMCFISFSPVGCKGHRPLRDICSFFFRGAQANGQNKGVGCGRVSVTKGAPVWLGILQTSRFTLQLYGCGLKLHSRGYAGVGPCFHLPGFLFGTVFWSPSYMELFHLTLGTLKRTTQIGLLVFS